MPRRFPVGDLAEPRLDAVVVDERRAILQPIVARLVEMELRVEHVVGVEAGMRTLCSLTDGVDSCVTEIFRALHSTEFRRTACRSLEGVEIPVSASTRNESLLREIEEADLSRAQRCALALRIAGFDGKETARWLGVSVSTVRTHISEALRRLGRPGSSVASLAAECEMPRGGCPSDRR